MPNALNCRALAAEVVYAVTVEGQSLSSALPYFAAQCPVKDKALLQELSYGVLRWRFRLANICNQLAPKGFSDADQDILELCLVGLYQLIYLRTPEHAAVAETVEAARQLGKDWAAPVVNGILRNFIRQSETLQAAADNNPQVRDSFPKWLYRAVCKDWPAEYETIFQNSNQRPPFTLRVNQSLTNRDDYLALLQQQGIEAIAHETVESAITLPQPIAVEQLPQFDQGWVSVQDAAGQQVAALLDLSDPQPLRVLDACCAPGGKSSHILELAPQSDLVCLDIDAQRLERVSANLSRLQQHATLHCADAAQPDSWWDGVQFDRIVLDVPCSATGVIRRHPDIKQLRRKADMDALIQTQQQLLLALWPLLKQNGLLLYTTCSILKQENELQIEQFVQQTKDARLLNLTTAHGEPMAAQVLPGQQNMDGFFYAKLQKVVA